MQGDVLPPAQKNKMETDIKEYFDWCRSRLKSNASLNNDENSNNMMNNSDGTSLENQISCPLQEKTSDPLLDLDKEITSIKESIEEYNKMKMASSTL